MSPVNVPHTLRRIMETTITPIILWRWNCPKNNHPNSPTINPRNPMIEPKAIRNSTDSPTTSKKSNIIMIFENNKLI